MDCPSGMERAARAALLLDQMLKASRTCLAAASAAADTDMRPVSAFCIMSGTMMFMISVDSGMTGNGTPYVSIEVVTSRKRMVSSRFFIHDVLKPRRLPGFDPAQASLVDHSGPVMNVTSARAAS